MSSEAITRNDLTAILNEVLLPTSIIMVEKKALLFSSGITTVSGKSGYYLANAYITDRSSGEHSYSITDINQDTSGNYTLSNKNTSLNATANFILIWIKEGGNNTTSVDCIVEQGTSGIWAYRKWNSGIAECWGKTNVPSTAYAANGGYKAVVETLPSGLFNSTPDIVEASGYIAGNIQTMMGFTAPNDANSIQAYLVNKGGSAVTQSGTIYWNVKGTWK